MFILQNLKIDNIGRKKLPILLTPQETTFSMLTLFNSSLFFSGHAFWYVVGIMLQMYILFFSININTSGFMLCNLNKFHFY